MFERILVPLDGSALAECVLPHVRRLAAIFDAQVTLVRVLEPPHDRSLAHAIDPVEWHLWKAEAHTELERVRAQLQEAGVAAAAVLLEGQAAQALLEYAYQRQASLIMLSSHGQGGLSDWNIGNVVQKLVMRANTALMIVPAYQPAEDAPIAGYGRLAVPLDGSQRAECALPIATRIAQAQDAELVLMHVVRTPEMPRHVPLTDEEQQLLDQVVTRNHQAATAYLARLQAQLPIPTTARLLVGDNVVAALYDALEAEQADLVLLTAHGYSGYTAWPCGSVATSFIAHSSFPLLIIQDAAIGDQPLSPAELAARQHGGH